MVSWSCNVSVGGSTHFSSFVAAFACFQLLPLDEKIASRSRKWRETTERSNWLVGARAGFFWRASETTRRKRSTKIRATRNPPLVSSQPSSFCPSNERAVSFSSHGKGFVRRLRLAVVVSSLRTYSTYGTYRVNVHPAKTRGGRHFRARPPVPAAASQLLDSSAKPVEQSTREQTIGRSFFVV